MGRIRTIKPEFFTDEKVGDLQPLARLLFAGLWTEADKVGVLEDRPRSLKFKLLPYDDCDVDGLLEELAAAGLIERYEVGGQRLIWVREFLKHQRPNPRETESVFPIPATVQIQIDDRANLDLHAQGGRERNGKERKECAGDPSAAPTETFRLAEVPAQKTRKLSAQEALAAQLIDSRDIHCPDSPDQSFGISRLNKMLGPLVEFDRSLVMRAHQLYCSDPRRLAQAPQCGLFLFSQDWPQYLELARREPA